MDKLECSFSLGRRLGGFNDVRVSTILATVKYRGEEFIVRETIGGVSAFDSQEGYNERLLRIIKSKKRVETVKKRMLKSIIKTIKAEINEIDSKLDVVDISEMVKEAFEDLSNLSLEKDGNTIKVVEK